MADLYIWEKYKANSSTSTVGTGRYNWSKYNVSTAYERDYRITGYESWAKEEFKQHYPIGYTLTKRGSLEFLSQPSHSSSSGLILTGISSVRTIESCGSLIGTVSGTYSQYTNNAKNSDGNWYVRGSEITTTTTSYSKGSYVGTVTAAYNAYSNNARNSDGNWYVRKGLANKVPTVTLTTANNLTLYEADTITVAGTATDTDSGNVVTVKYKIAESVEKALTAAVSDGSNAIPFNKSLVFKGGKILDGETAITDVLTDGNAYTLSVWAEDNQGGKSTVQTRTFYVVPNRAPSLVVNEFDASACIIDSDKFTISGTCEDADGNDMKVGYRINGGNFVQAYDGSDGNWEFELELGQLKSGENTIAIEAIDSYDFKTSQTLTLNKNTVSTQVLKGVTRYTINPPSGSAKGILLWIQHDAELTIDGCYLSLTDNAEAENFVEMENTNTANMPNSTDVVESEFVLETETPKEKIMLKIEFSRASVDVSPTIKLISGVME